ncbi:PHR domain [Mactra antiquata]
MASSKVDLTQDWQSSTPFSASIWRLYNEQIGCDVVFEIGQYLERRGSHTTVLMSRSVVFFHEFASGPPNLEIQLPDFQPEEFDCFIEFLYTGKLNLPEGLNKMKVLELAERYRVMELERMLMSRQLSSMKVEEFAPFVKKNEKQMNSLIKFKCLEYIFNQAEAVFKSKNFIQLPLSFLHEVLSHERFVLQEDIISDALLLWSNNACVLQGLEVNGTNRRSVLKDVFYSLRPTLLSKDYFEDNISETGFLSDAEELVVLKHFLNSKRGKDPKFPFVLDERVAPLTPFVYTPTGEELEELNDVASSSTDLPIEHPLTSVVEHRVERFAEIGLGWGHFNDNKDAVGLSVSENIRLDYVYVYGPCRTDGNMTVNLEIQDENTVISSTEVKLACTMAETTYEVGVENDSGSYGVHLNANKIYHIIVRIYGENTFYGKIGKSSIQVENVTLTFTDSKYSTNRTSANMGQIAGLKFIIV